MGSVPEGPHGKVRGVLKADFHQHPLCKLGLFLHAFGGGKAHERAEDHRFSQRLRGEVGVFLPHVPLKEGRRKEKKGVSRKKKKGLEEGRVGRRKESEGTEMKEESEVKKKK